MEEPIDGCICSIVYRAMEPGARYNGRRQRQTGNGVDQCHHDAGEPTNADGTTGG